MNTLKDSLYNLSPASGASVEYARGLLVGTFAALMFAGHTFDNAARIVRDNLPADYRPDALPDGYAARMFLPTATPTRGETRRRLARRR